MQITLYNISIIYLLLIGLFLIYITKIIDKLKQTIYIINIFFNTIIIDFLKQKYYILIGRLINYPKGVSYILSDGFGLTNYKVYKLKFNKKIDSYFSYKIKFKYKYIHLYFSKDEKWYIYIPLNNSIYRVKTNYYKILKIINPTLYIKLTNVNKCCK
jgi:hypothetical protein